MRRLSLALTALYFAPQCVQAGTVSKGGDCSVASQRLSLGTYQFYAECDIVTFCNATTSKCEPKGCRKDQYPFGYADNADFPPMCPSGKFCPDEEDQCLDVLQVGSLCQFNRDDQCQPPPGHEQLKDVQGFGRNINGAVCLHNTCMWANATSGEACTVENTVYALFGSDGHEYADIISRDNCQTGSYCDSSALVCKDSKNVGGSCTGNKECSSFNCLPSGTCGLSTDTPAHVSEWVYAVVAVCALGGIVGILCLLFMLHKKEREEARMQRTQYWEEQNALRQGFLSMQHAAHMSLRSSDDNMRTPVSRSFSKDSYYDDPQTPPTQGPSKSFSGLRYSIVSDGRTDSQPQTPYLSGKAPSSCYASR
ncbi:uncharacterized protein B0H18DRAFT_416058 [Fomitopsis serialis]|uniref:uncharacterized protein n=1 Tax=Fomitopsis serialis TaxID=139415 RepID=UPI002008C59B|nr:uncharacterized protein B0H18DRAFT_416058 [Neoantrodia serialis]KAH9935539.1 hypothetical protein B0H18DRAFT_416058 [Neoantrodia serialis]